MRNNNRGTDSIMAKVAKEHRDELPKLKQAVEDWQDYFDENNKRFHEYKRMVFETSVTSDERQALMSLGKPDLEFNILEAYISRLRGNFAEHEPSIKVRAAEGLSPEQMTPELMRTVSFVEDHMRYIFSNVSNDNLEFDTYTNTLSGGFAGLKVRTEYINPMSMDQRIVLKQAHDPTKMGFDPMAELSHKGDGQYCYEIVPLTYEDFVARYGKAEANDIKFTRNPDSFAWSYSDDTEQKVALVVYLYKKKMKREKIAKLSNGKVILRKNYDEIVKLWDMAGYIEQAPQIIKERYTDIETIWLYEMSENTVFKAYQTSHTYLPDIFVDGNSAIIRPTTEGSTVQMTRPYVYHAKGIQKLKNFSGQTLGAEIEQMVQHKFIAAIESIPDDYVEAYQNPQRAMTLAYHAFYDKDAEKALPPPQVLQRAQTPPIVENIFSGSDMVTKSILGSYDAVQGDISGKNLSGVAIRNGAMQSDQTAVPYMVNYIRGLNRAAQVIMSLIPKYYVTPRSIPVLKSNGMRDYQVINEVKNPYSPSAKYEPHMLDVSVEMGVNSAMQKQMALEMIEKLMNASEVFAQFINDEGLEVLLDNIDIRGVDELREKAIKYMEAKKKALQEQANQPSPEEQVFMAQIQTEQQKTQQKATEAQMKHERELQEQQIKYQEHLQEMTLKQQELDQKWIEIMSKIDEVEARLSLDAAKADAEMARDIMEAAREQMESAVDATEIERDQEL